MGRSQPEFGQQLRRHRQERGLSQRELADGFTTPSYISLLESGQRSPTLEVLVNLAQRLELPIGALTDEAPAVAPVVSPAPPAARVLALRSRGAWQDALTVQQAAFDAAVAAGHDADALALGDVLLSQLPDDDTAGRTEVLGRLVETSRRLDEPDVRVSFLVDLAAAMRNHGTLRDAARVARDALAATETASQQEIVPVRIRALSVLISALCDLDEFDEVPAMVEQMITLARRTDDATAARAAWSAAIAYGLLARHDDAVTQIRRAVPLLSAPDISLRDWLRFARSAASAFLAAGDLDEAGAWLRAAEPVARTLSLDHETAQLAALQARYWLTMGDPQAAVAWYEQVEAVTDLPVTDQAAAAVVQARALNAVGRTADARRLAAATAARCDAAAAYRLAAEAWRLSAELAGSADSPST